MSNNIKFGGISEVLDKESDDWSQWARFVLISLEKLGKSVTDLNKDYYKIREELVKTLSQMKEELRKEICNKANSCGDEDKARLSELKIAVDNVIDGLSERISSLEDEDCMKDCIKYVDDELKKLKDKYIDPIKIEQTSVFSKLNIVGAIVLILGSGVVVFILNAIKTTLFGG